MDPTCPNCLQIQYVIKSGLNRSGTQRFRWQDWARYFTLPPKPLATTPRPVSKPSNFIWKALLIGRLVACYMSIIKSIINRVEAAQKLLPDEVSDQGRTDYVKVNELFSFVEAKKTP